MFSCYSIMLRVLFRRGLETHTKLFSRNFSGHEKVFNFFLNACGDLESWGIFEIQNFLFPFLNSSAVYKCWNTLNCFWIEINILLLWTLNCKESCLIQWAAFREYLFAFFSWWLGTLVVLYGECECCAKPSWEFRK